MLQSQHTLELDEQVEISNTSVANTNRTPTRFTDPKFQYKPKPQKRWVKQTLNKQKKHTPIGRLSGKSWKFIIAEAETFEDSGMQTKILPVLPPVTKDVDVVKDQSMGPTPELSNKKTNARITTTPRVQTRALSQSLPSRVYMHAREISQSRMSHTIPSKDQSDKKESKSKPKPIEPHIRLGNTIRF